MKRDDPLPEQRTRAFGLVAGELLDQQAGHQQRLETVAKTIGEKAADTKAPIDEIGGAEGERKGERRLGGAFISEPPCASRPLDQRLGVAHQRLHGGGGSRAPRQRFKNQHPFLVAERHQRDRQPLALGSVGLLRRNIERRPRRSRPDRAPAPAPPPRDANRARARCRE